MEMKESLTAQIAAKGEEIKAAKAAKVDKAALQPLIDALLALKAEYKVVVGEPFPNPNARGSKKKKVGGSAGGGDARGATHYRRRALRERGCAGEGGARGAAHYQRRALRERGSAGGGDARGFAHQRRRAIRERGCADGGGAAHERHLWRTMAYSLGGGIQPRHHIAKTFASERT